MKKIIILSILIFISCKSNQALLPAKHSYPKPVDTTTKPTWGQKKQVYHLEGLSASNNFPSARLNSFVKENDGTYTASIWPENYPINPSPWYAFKLWSSKEKEVVVHLDYSNGAKHRYAPKLSADGEQWKQLDASQLEYGVDSTRVALRLKVNSDTLWVAAQEIQDHRRVGEWVQRMTGSSWVTQSVAGKSVLGRDLYHMNISKGAVANKPTIVILSRQHPPEVTGFLCMKAFVETIISEGATNGFLDQYRVMVYPLMNPDGVDLGHYRHNVGGVDLNRDWSAYHQPEIAAVTGHIVRETVTQNNEVLLGLDFHSTYHDVYYTPDATVTRKIPDFTKAWLEKIRIATGLEKINEAPGPISQPTSSAWFNQQFGATGITYEIGDDTSRDFIKIKGVESARAMMQLLIKK